MTQSLVLEERKYLRVPLNRKALVISVEHTKIHAKIKEISLTGGGLLLSKPVKVGMHLILMFRLPSIHGLVEIRTMCRTTHCRLQHDVYYVGIEFQGLNPSAQKEILTYVNYKLR